MTIGLSTAWLGGERSTIEQVVRAARDLGFTEFEIGVAGEMLPAAEFRRLAGELGVSFVSVHNIAYRDGLPPDEIRGDGLSSVDSTVRQRAIDATCRTVDLAREVGARFVVVHAGDVDVKDGNRKQHAARLLIEAGRLVDARVMMHEHMAERNSLAPRNVELAAASLSAVFRRTGDFPLAMECRVHYYSIPMPSELRFLATILGSHPVRYWHDTGHARVIEMLGLAAARHWLEEFQDILAGFHLHDVRTMSDHEVPGTGDLDFRMFAPYMRPETIRILELHWHTTPDQLVSARRTVEAAGLG